MAAIAFPEDDSPDLTRILQQLRGRHASISAEAFAAIYAELRKLARIHMSKERASHTLQTTALIHEAYLKIAGLERIEWSSRTHFFAVASQIMRQILVDYARRRSAEKHGGGFLRVELNEGVALTEENLESILLVDAALNKLQHVDARQAQVVELRFFAGLSNEQIAEYLGVSERTVKRDWKFAQAWLYGEITGESGSPGDQCP